MSFFWPINKNPLPSVLTRLGRVCHWTALALAAVFVALGVLIALTEGVEDGGFVWAMGGAAAFWAMAGRGVRYIFSGE